MTRIALVLSYYPTDRRPHRGMPFFHKAKALSELAELGIFVTSPQYPDHRFLRPRRFAHSGPEQPISLPGVSVRSVPYPALPMITRVLNGGTCGKRLLPHLREFRPDVVLAYQVYPEAYAAVYAARALNIPCVVGAIGSDIRCSPAMVRPLVRRTLRNASFVVTVCDELSARAIQLGATACKVATIRNGCDPEIFQPRDRAAARQSLGVSAASRLVVFTGNLVAVKGLPDLIRATALLNNGGTSMDVTLIGSGPLESELRELSRGLGIERSIRFTGALPPATIAQWLGAADVFCLPSHSEGSPNAIIEALQCGRPVVASNVGGIPELLNPTSGILVPPANPAALATALQHAFTRHWDETAIAKLNGRTWKDMARDTYQACLGVLHNDRVMEEPLSLTL